MCRWDAYVSGVHVWVVCMCRWGACVGGMHTWVGWGWVGCMCRNMAVEMGWAKTPGREQTRKAAAVRASCVHTPSAWSLYPHTRTSDRWSRDRGDAVRCHGGGGGGGGRSFDCCGSCGGRCSWCSGSGGCLWGWRGNFFLLAMARHKDTKNTHVKHVLSCVHAARPVPYKKQRIQTTDRYSRQ
jgi:hypothetical protein